MPAGVPVRPRWGGGDVVKSAGAIRHKLKQVRYRHLKRRLDSRLKLDPVNCAHNVQVALPDGADVYVCQLKVAEGSLMAVCDDRTELSIHHGCTVFDPIESKEDIKAEYRDFLATASLAEIAAECPDMAALLWVLEDEAPNRDVEIDSDEDWSDEDTEEETPQETGEGPAEAWQAELDRLREENERLQGDIEAKNRDHAHVGEQLREAQSELAKWKNPPENPTLLQRFLLWALGMR